MPHPRLTHRDREDVRRLELKQPLPTNFLLPCDRAYSIAGDEPFFEVELVARVRWIGGADVRVTVVGDLEVRWLGCLEAVQGWFGDDAQRDWVCRWREDGVAALFEGGGGRWISWNWDRVEFV
jgi:hypothetical protein